ncbi:CRISPR-associated endonuclease Cas2 [Candidatus Nomurabacteria bacterium]|nr:CRISPR-associated endonuclease Cas2 [Candidatus Nomurabacteria bacterium]
MSIEKEILKYLSENKNKRVIRNRGVRIGFLGLPDFKHYKYQTLANRCSDLKNKGYIKEVNGTFLITYKGEEFLNQKSRDTLKVFETERGDKDPKNLLLLYDIPEDKRSERNWFRRQLVKFHFVMIQRSVWVGPSPIPKDFLEYLKSVGLKDTIKTFKLEKGYTVNI